MEANTINIAGIFNRARLLKIPHFQRAYVWKEEQWERLLDDMRYAATATHPYFMGSIILKQQETTTGQQAGDVRTIIDGQQRLTTILLFFKVLFAKNGKAHEFFNTFKTFSGELILEHNYSDKPVFEKILMDQEVEEEEKLKQIYKCFEYFSNNISENEIDQNRLLGNVAFVSIDIQQNEDEQQIFDTINSLGVSLTTAELLKNYLFKDDIESYNQNWRDVFEYDDEIRSYWEQELTVGRASRSNIDLFLQAYLFIKINERDLNVSTEDKKRFFKIDSVFNSFKELIKKYDVETDTIVAELRDYAKTYKETITPSATSEDINRADHLKRLNLVMFGLDTLTILPYVLYIAKKANEVEKNSIFKFIEAYIMRRIVSRATTKNYNKLFRETLINNQALTLQKLMDIIENKDDKIDYMPADEEITRSFNETVLSNKQAKGVLYLIERTIRSDMNATELKFFDEYSLEHVLPKKWRNNWDLEQRDEQKSKQRDRKLLTLGNLTIITKALNSSIRDSDWATKKSGRGNHKGLTEYAQGIETFSRYLQRDDWDESVIKERAKALAQYAINDVWSINQT